MSGQRPDNRDERIQSTSQQPESHDSGQLRHATTAAPAQRRRTTAKPPRTQPKRTSATPAAKLTGVVGDASSSGSRSGEDVRKRGWFWHWNSIVTQYAPLIGLKGVGLLNSYTVWTDRREESPHRGYAFPSQQSEADFYGEDRAELITINKILVALDLIEIRKEMVLRVDGQGRRWKVPHNLYRVKDHGDDTSLTAEDVMRVVELAGKDRAVYRYLRRIFSPRFAPIDGDNVWHQILEEVRQTETWQRLAARTERDERKASARSKAGHASRRENEDTGLFSLPKSGDSAASEATLSDSNDSAVNDSETGDQQGVNGHEETSVATTNNGLATDDEQSNNGSSEIGSSSVATANRGGATNVQPSNTTYYQSLTTTTGDDQFISQSGVRTQRRPEEDRFGTEQPPDSTRSEAQAWILFEEANGRTPSAAERRQLRQLAERIATLGFSGHVDSWNLIAAAIEDAVAAGSAFVATKRIREIVLRWSRDGVPAEYAENVSAPGAADSVAQDRLWPVTSGAGASHRSVAAVSLPNGMSGEQVWGAVERAVRAELGEKVAEGLFASTAIIGYDAGEVTIAVGDARQYEAFTVTHRDRIVRSLRGVLRRPVRLTVIANGHDPDDDNDGAARAAAPRERADRLRPARRAP
ncbi:MAG TPA: hypothetical protein VNZ55_03930, partial [Thermomicrobiales bacterium]|nr:hypothetical protein [Thermomicrobiales bacterium]